MAKKYQDWAEGEVKLVVDAYLHMLKLELEQMPFVKAHENARLRESLNKRSKGSVEYKFQNISAVLVRLHRTPIRGYKPASNSQLILASAVADALKADPALDTSSSAAFDPHDWVWFNV